MHKMCARRAQDVCKVCTRCVQGVRKICAIKVNKVLGYLLINGLVRTNPIGLNMLLYI